MDLKQLKIKNIRSFTDEVIEFPSGTTLLAGSIGAGKSTILLAIEFALFGITKEISGAALLRNGADKGTVELSFAIDKKEITIKRSLKRGSSVTQEAGFISINNATREATATELRQAILSLLNYPQEFLTKSPSTIYRYTVYTPQEEMKSILLGSRDDRMAILSRVFGIDKYKLMKENAELFIANIRAKAREFAVVIADLEEKRAEEKATKEEIAQKEKIVQGLLPQIEKLRDELREEKKKCLLFEEEMKKMQEIKKAREICETTIQHKINESGRLKARQTRLEEAIHELESEVNKEKDEPKIEKSVEEMEKKMQQQELERREMIKQVQERKTLIQQSEKIKDDVQKLDTCPVCKQKVDSNHRNEVKEEEEKKINEHQRILQELQRAEEKKEQEIKEIKQELE